MDNSTCPCCGYSTFPKTNVRGSYDICAIRYWEDEAVQYEDPSYTGGANGVSLKQAQKNFIEFGACEFELIKNVRKPNANDVKDLEWVIVE